MLVDTLASKITNLICSKTIARTLLKAGEMLKHTKIMFDGIGQVFSKVNATNTAKNMQNCKFQLIIIKSIPNDCDQQR